MLSSGLEITIPNNQLIVPVRTIDSEGQPVIINDTSRAVRINALEDINKNDMPLLGQVFLSAAYLLVDNAAEEFFLWKGQAVPTQDVVPFGQNNNCPSPTAHSSANPLGAPEAAKHHTSAGTIVGILIGVFAVIAAVAGAIWWIRWRKRRFGTDGGSYGSRSDLNFNGMEKVLNKRSTIQELDTARRERYVGRLELPGTPKVRYQYGQHEMSGSSSFDNKPLPRPCELPTSRRSAPPSIYEMPGELTNVI